MDVVGVAEISKMLAVSRQRVYQLVKQKGFPAPMERLAMGPVWRRAAIERWAERTGRSVH